VKAIVAKEKAAVPTTLFIDADLYAWIRQQMEKDGCTLRHIVNKALRKLAGK
jgi:hypothetical protein